VGTGVEWSVVGPIPTAMNTNTSTIMLPEQVINCVTIAIVEMYATCTANVFGNYINCAGNHDVLDWPTARE